MHSNTMVVITTVARMEDMAMAAITPLGNVLESSCTRTKSGGTSILVAVVVLNLLLVMGVSEVVCFCVVVLAVGDAIGIDFGYRVAGGKVSVIINILVSVTIATLPSSSTSLLPARTAVTSVVSSYVSVFLVHRKGLRLLEIGKMLEEKSESISLSIRDIIFVTEGLLFDMSREWFIIP